MNTANQTDADSITAGLDSIWREILAKECGADEDFFDAGGSSLGGIRVLVEVKKAYGVDIDAERFFKEPTKAALRSAILESLPKG